MSINRKHVYKSISYVALFNVPLLFLLPGFGGALLLLCQFWVNIPGIFLWRRLGESYFHVHPFGVTPITPLAWGLVSGFWTLIALILAVVSVQLPDFSWHFSLRTLLIATMLVAIGLGLAVYAMRN